MGGDDDEGVWVGCVPYEVFGRDFRWREEEFDGSGIGKKRVETKCTVGLLHWIISRLGHAQFRLRVLSTVRCRALRLTGHQVRIGAKDMTRMCEQKKKETRTCLWSSTAPLCAQQLNLNTLSPDTVEPTSVEDVINEDQCVLAVLASDCAMLRVR